MDQSLELLKSVSQAARMGLNSVDSLIVKVEDEGIREELLLKQTEYQKFRRESEDRMVQMGVKPKAVNPMTRVGAWMGMQMDTLVDRSSSHIADMLIQGATMGIVDLTKAQGMYPQADEDAHRIATDFLNAENASIERAKGFL